MKTSVALKNISASLRALRVSALKSAASSVRSWTLGVGRWTFVFFLIPLCPFLSSCSIRPLRGGRALTTGPISQSLAQGDNPSAPSRQTQETITTRTYTLPSSSLARRSLGGGGIPFSRNTEHGARVVDRTEVRATTELGPAQKDTARELGAKLSSLRPITWVGLGLFIFGLVSLFWPPLQALIASVTTSVAITAGGMALIILPTLIIGHELLILAAVAVGVLCWFLAHRHGHLRGQLKSATPTKR